MAFAPAIRSRWLAETASLAGAGLIAACLITSSGGGSGVYPDLLLACGGAALIVLPKHPPTLVSSLLALRPIRFIGEISYSLYLWHWPVLVFFAHYYLLDDSLSWVAMAAYLPGIAVLATLSWRFVERPFRKWRPKAPVSVLGGMATAAVFTLTGWGITAAQGLPARIPDQAARYASYLDEHRIEGEFPRCWTSGSTDPALFEADKCLTIDPERPNVLLIGDSHANQFSRAIRVMFPEVNISYVGASGCWPLVHSIGARRCLTMMDRVFDRYIPQMRFDAVILSARWSAKSKRLKHLPETIDYIRRSGSEVIILGPSHEYRQDLPTLLAYGVLRGDAALRGQESNRIAKAADKAVRSTAAELDVPYFSPFEIACAKSPCMTLTPEDEPMLFDDNHLSDPGALYVLKAFRDQGLLANLLPD